MSNEFRDAAGLIPVGDIDVGLLIDMASVSSAEAGCINCARLKLIVCPLRLSRVVPEKCDRRIILVENRDAAFQF